MSTKAATPGGRVLFVREQPWYSWSDMWAVIVVAAAAGIAWAGFYTWWRAEPVKGLLPALAVLFPMLPPRAYVLNDRGVWRGPAILMRIHRRRARPGQLLLACSTIDAYGRSHWYGRPAIVVYTSDGNDELLCPADPGQAAEILEWLDAHTSTVT